MVYIWGNGAPFQKQMVHSSNGAPLHNVMLYLGRWCTTGENYLVFFERCTISGTCVNYGAAFQKLCCTFQMVHPFRKFSCRLHMMKLLVHCFKRYTFLKSSAQNKMVHNIHKWCTVLKGAPTINAHAQIVKQIAPSYANGAPRRQEHSKLP